MASPTRHFLAQHLYNIFTARYGASEELKIWDLAEKISFIIQQFQFFDFYDDLDYMSVLFTTMKRDCRGAQIPERSRIAIVLRNSDNAGFDVVLDVISKGNTLLEALKEEVDEKVSHSWIR